MSASRFGPPALHQPGPAPVHASVASVARIALGLLLALAALPCGTHANGTATAPHDGAKFRRQEPFVTRPFKPFIGDRWIGEAVAYGPHRDGQRPDGDSPTGADVREDLLLIAQHWNLIRVYGAVGTADTVLSVIRQGPLPLRVMLGIWVGAEDRRDSTGRVLERLPAVAAMNRREIETALRLIDENPGVVVAVCVGNETQVSWSAARVPPERLVETIRELRARTRLPVTTADDFNYWNKPESEMVARELDLIVTHLHPLWNGSSLAHALDWIREHLAEVRAMHPGRAVIIGETGWATMRNDLGDQGHLMKGTVGEAEQAMFYREASAWVRAARTPTFFFEAFDENWKGGPDPADVEKHWGFFHTDRTPKPALSGER